MKGNECDYIFEFSIKLDIDSKINYQIKRIQKTKNFFLILFKNIYSTTELYFNKEKQVKETKTAG